MKVIVNSTPLIALSLVEKLDLLQRLFDEVDERLGRRVAKALKFPLKGTLGILLAAVIADLMTKQEALTSLSKMLEEGIRISPRWQNWLRDELDKLEQGA